ncbi:MAG TPA: CsbD family protein [bacterium]|nr:CsbD family protein [bacterium]
MKSNWNRLTDNELDQVNGDADTLISMIQEKYQEPRASIEMQIEHMLAA